MIIVGTDAMKHRRQPFGFPLQRDETREVEKCKSGMSLVAVPCDSEKPQEKRKEGSMAEEKVGTGLFLLYLYFRLQCKKGRGQAIWK